MLKTLSAAIAATKFSGHVTSITLGNEAEIWAKDAIASTYEPNWNALSLSERWASREGPRYDPRVLPDDFARAPDAEAPPAWSAAAPVEKAIPRFAWPEGEAAALASMAKGLPVVLKDWPLMPGVAKWDGPYLARHLGDAPLEVVWAPARSRRFTVLRGAGRGCEIQRLRARSLSTRFG